MQVKTVLMITNFAGFLGFNTHPQDQETMQTMPKIYYKLTLRGYGSEDPTSHYSSQKLPWTKKNKVKNFIDNKSAGVSFQSDTVAFSL